MFSNSSKSGSVCARPKVWSHGMTTISSAGNSAGCPGARLVGQPPSLSPRLNMTMMLQPMPQTDQPLRYIRGTTPFPNFLLDRVMPRLSDTEWRLLTVIVRQTFGWNLGHGQRKSADWMSHTQLKQRTGRASAALSRSIDVLVRSGLIVVRDSLGHRLITSADRRRSRQHLAFGLNPLATSPEFQRQFALTRFRNSQSENDKSKDYKRKQQHRNYSSPTRKLPQ